MHTILTAYLHCFVLCLATLSGMGEDTRACNGLVKSSLFLDMYAPPSTIENKRS